MNNNQTLKPGYKNSPLGPIPEDWDVVELINNMDLLTGYAFKSEDFKEQGIKLLRGSNVKRYMLDWNADITRYWPADTIYKKFQLQENDIVVALDGALVGSSLARVKDHDLPCYLVQRVARIRAKKADQGFIYFQLANERFQTYVDSVKTHTAIPHISPGDLRKYPIPLPPLPEQTAIANCLSTWDKAISATSELIAQKELRKKWLMQQLLTGKKRVKSHNQNLQNERMDRMNAAPHSENSGHSDSDNGNGVGEWREVRLGDVFERVTRKNQEGNKTVVTISAQRGFVRQEDFFSKQVASEILDNYFLVYNGEFCYNKSYSNGYPWGATKRLKDFDKAVVTTLYICFRLNDANLSSGDFFEQFFEANMLDKGLTEIAHEGGRAHGLLNVTPVDFFGLKVKVPGFKEQTAIAAILQKADEELALLRQKLEALKEQKKGLMQVLLTGKKRLKLN